MRKVFWENGALIEAGHFHHLEAWVETLCRCSSLIGSRYGLLRDVSEKTFNVFMDLSTDANASIRLSADQTGLDRNEVRINLANLRAVLPGAKVIEIREPQAFLLTVRPREPTPLFLCATGCNRLDERSVPGVALRASDVELAIARREGSIPIAILGPGGSLDNSFIPPSLTVGSSDVLWKKVKETVARIDKSITRGEGLLYKLATAKSSDAEQQSGVLELLRLTLATWRAVRPRLEDQFLSPLMFLDHIDQFLQAVRRDWRGLSLAPGAVTDDQAKAFAAARDEGNLSTIFSALGKVVEGLTDWFDDLGERYGEVARDAIVTAKFTTAGDWHQTTITFTQPLNQLRKGELEIQLACKGAEGKKPSVIINPIKPPRRPTPDSRVLSAIVTKKGTQEYIKFKFKPTDDELARSRLDFYIYTKDRIVLPEHDEPWQGVLKIKGLTDA